APGANPEGPPPQVIAAALARTGFGHVRVSSERIELRRPGMALTLNGIAQGYITDRIVELLKAGGIESCLVDIGESRGLGRHPEGRGWRVGISDPRQSGGTIEQLELVDRAIATSSPTGFAFDPASRFHHLIDPRSGRTPRRYESISEIGRASCRERG